MTTNEQFRFRVSKVTEFATPPGVVSPNASDHLRNRAVMEGGIERNLVNE